MCRHEKQGGIHTEEISTQRRENSDRGEALHNCMTESSNVKLDHYPRRLTPMQETRLQYISPITSKTSPSFRESSQAFELFSSVGGSLCWMYASKSSISLGSAE